MLFIGDWFFKLTIERPVLSINCSQDSPYAEHSTTRTLAKYEYWVLSMLMLSLSIAYTLVKYEESEQEQELWELLLKFVVSTQRQTICLDSWPLARWPSMRCHVSASVYRQVENVILSFNISTPL